MRLTRAVVGAYFLVVVLHGFWDGLPSALAWITTSGIDFLLSQTLVGIVGLIILWRRWRRAVKEQLEPAPLPAPVVLPPAELP